MRFSSNRKSNSPANRRDALRLARSAAPTLRVAFPAAALVCVELEFREESGPPHAPQAFSVYPPAKAHFVYACPFGDCDGVYDLNEIARSTLGSEGRNTHGRLVCTGTRSRNGQSDCPCELAAIYSITVKDEELAAL